MAVYQRFNGKRIKPSDPNWERGKWVVEFNLRGHRVKEAIPEARTKKQAEQAEAQIKQAIFDRKYNRASAVTRFSDFVDGVFLPWTRENKRSWKDDRQRAKKLKEFFGQRAIRDITPMLIEKFRSELRKSDSRYGHPFSPATVNPYLQVLSRILSMAYENGIVDSNPMSRVKFVMRGRNGKSRLVPLNARALAILKRLRQDAPDDELVFDKARTGRKRRQMMVCFGRAVEEAGVDDLHFHDLRHTFATRLRAANVHEYDIADLPGHSTTPGETRNTKVTRGYAHGIPQRLRDAVDSLEEGKRVILATPTLR